jgi:hypothetical protein
VPPDPWIGNDADDEEWTPNLSFDSNKPISVSRTAMMHLDAVLN